MATPKMDRGGLVRMGITMAVLLLVSLGWYWADGSTECLWATGVVGLVWGSLVAWGWKS